jgi:hypothetical protein
MQERKCVSGCNKLLPECRSPTLEGNAMQLRTFFESIHVEQAVLSFTGWPDAGEMIQQSVTELQQMLPWQLAAIWDLDGFWHADAIRPRVDVQHGQIRGVEWPCYRFFVSRDSQLKPILLGTGPEPSCNWREFARMLLEQLARWGCGQIVLLGSVYDQVFHDEITISAVVQETGTFNRVRELGCQRVQYRGPGAIHAAIMENSQPLGINCIGLWAHLPCYIKGPSELLMSHYFQVLGGLLGVKLDTQHLETAWQQRLQQIDELISQDRDLQQLLEQLKAGQCQRKIESGNCAKVVRLDEFLKKKTDQEPGSEV